MTTQSDPGFVRERETEVERQTRDIEQRMLAQAGAAGVSLERPNAPAGEKLARVTAGLGRREFLSGSVKLAGSVAIANVLQTLHARKARASTPLAYQVANPYGDPVPTADEVTGLPLIGLPPGFRYWSHGWTGDPIFPNVAGSPITPALHDGMAVLLQLGSWAVICRNHEVAEAPSYSSGSFQYSPGGGGGNTNMIFDTRARRWIAVWPTLSGTVRNCAGGRTDHLSWLSCEESLAITVGPDGKQYKHGWVFDVPAFGVSDGKPIRAMGLREHEACSVDPHSGYVYLTEDRAPGGIYRFRPHRAPRWAPYSNGGKLEMLRVVGQPNAVLTGLMPRFLQHGVPYPAAIGEPLDIDWVPINDPENLGGVVNFDQGTANGGATFERPEGAWYDDGKIYFVSTDGGSTGNGQVFSLDIDEPTLTLIYDAPLDANGMPSELDNPDNVTVTPRGGLLFCEDNSGDPAFTLGGISTERLVGLTQNGQIFTFAHNLIDFRPTSQGGFGPYTRPSGVTFTGQQRANEWAGATFDRSGEWLFVNIQTPGVTFAITGPWSRGPL